MTEFLNLNDDCLRHVFRFVDMKALCAISETCKLLKRIAEEFFGKHKSYECNIAVAEDVKEVAQIMQKIGKHLIKLDLTLDLVDSKLYVKNGIGSRFLLQLNCWLGENFRDLTLHGQIWSIPVLRLAPTLLKLEKLSICCEYDETQEGVTMFMDLPQLCPNLRTLRIEGCALVFAPNPIKSFETLEVLTFLSFGPYYPMASFLSLIQDNKQLKKLDVDYLDEIDDKYVDLTIVVKNLKHLEDLRIRTVLFANVVAGINDMKQLYKLTVLVMSEYWDDLEQLSDVLDIIKTMKQLKKLRIGNCMCGSPNQQSVVNISKHLQLLETFESNIECDSDTVTAFVQLGHNLKRFSVEASEASGREWMTLPFIENLAIVRETAAGTRSPLSLYIHRVRLSKHIEKVFKGPRFARLLKLDYSPMVPERLIDYTDDYQ